MSQRAAGLFREIKRIVGRMMAGNVVCQEARGRHRRWQKLRTMVCSVGIGGYNQHCARNGEFAQNLAPLGPGKMTFGGSHGTRIAWELVSLQTGLPQLYKMYCHFGHFEGSFVF